MNYRNELTRLAQEQDPSLLDKIEQYASLRILFEELTGSEDADESYLFDVLSISDEEIRREAARTARQLRYLSRYICSRLHY